MQNFVKIGEMFRYGDLRYLEMYVAKYKNKYPLFLWIKVMMSNPDNRHHCSICFYSVYCNYECKVIEGSKSVKGFIEREYGLKAGDYCLTPMVVKKNENIKN